METVAYRKTWSSAVCWSLLLSSSSVLAESEAEVSKLDDADNKAFKAFIEFNAKYSRSYASLDDHNQRFDVFKDNLSLIEEHNSRDDLDFKMGINPFSDLSMA